MTMYFMGGEMAGFIPSDNASVEDASAGYFDSAFSRCATRVSSTTAYFETPDLGLPDEFYVHFAFRRGTTGSFLHTLIALVDGTTEVFRVQATGTTLQMQALVSSVWTNVGSAISYTQDVLNHVDLYIDGNSATGTATLFIAGTQRESATADLSAVTSINKLRFYGIGTVTTCLISQCVVSSTSTVGGRLFTVPPTGVGATSSWTGAYSNIDEIAYSDADFINSGTANQVSTFAVTAPSLTGYVVRAVAVNARAKRDSAGPQNLQLALRSSGTDYFSSSKALSVGYSSYCNIWETDPATSAAWVNSAVTSLQPGVKSIT